ncbi:MAG: phosphoribosylamine--glycine ligase [Acidobacteriaceae bacterium]|nr:phosphoribosylamine--glycine ligase [Acidobacteriaceae bacterium]
MKVLIVGGGGREHALAWRLAQSPQVKRIVASPGNPGIAKLANCVPSPDSVSGYADIAQHFEADLTIVGPEAPLVSGIVDRFRNRGLRIVGPTAAAAQLEGSKNFAKQLFKRAGIPTARHSSEIKDFSFPIVIKADGLAAGKGVIIAREETEARLAIQRLGPDVIIEEFLEGEEVSFIGLSDGASIYPFTPSQDHKRVFDGDRGPNTGGMGAYCDSRILSAAQSGEVMERIMLPAVRQLAIEGTPFTGFLYAGLMMTAEGPKVLEFNARLGDPEAQALLYSFEGDFADLLIGGVRAANQPTPPAPRPSVCVVMAAEGYPENPRTGDEVHGMEAAEATGATVFQAGTRREGSVLVTNGGRVLGVTAGGDTLQTAISKAYAAAGKIQFAGMHYRTDIGQRGLKRW